MPEARRGGPENSFWFRANLGYRARAYISKQNYFFFLVPCSLSLKLKFVGLMSQNVCQEKYYHPFPQISYFGHFA